MATLRCAVYAPPRKGMPFLVAGTVGASVQFAHGAKTRKQAEAILEREIETLKTRARLQEAYGNYGTKSALDKD